MYYGGIDYTAEEVAKLSTWFTQYLRYEEQTYGREKCIELRSIWEILRGVSATQLGTKFISELKK